MVSLLMVSRRAHHSTTVLFEVWSTLGRLRFSHQLAKNAISHVLKWFFIFTVQRPRLSTKTKDSKSQVEMLKTSTKVWSTVCTSAAKCLRIFVSRCMTH